MKEFMGTNATLPLTLEKINSTLFQSHGIRMVEEAEPKYIL
jgi:hypothetical protein